MSNDKLLCARSCRILVHKFMFGTVLLAFKASILA